MDSGPAIVVPEATLTRWADTCLHMNHLGTLVKREIQAGNYARAQDLSERARRRAWDLLNEERRSPMGMHSPEPKTNNAQRATFENARA